ncbi:MAG: efflux RND transporter permease subunit [Rhodospirillales bacterium]|nr:efflux RND transporter permease subunit [Rhodospirillales bacterium]
MEGITRFSLENSRTAVAAVVLIVVVGLWQFVDFPRQEDPPIVIREAVVTASFPGMPPAEMEQLITRRIEAEIRTMPEIGDITSDTKTGEVTIHAETRDEYDDLPEIWKRLRNRMDDLASSLPEGTSGPFVNDEFGLTAIATVALWSDGFTMAEMRQVAQDIRDRLYGLEGIRKVELYGVQEEEVTLSFANAKLAQTGVSILSIMNVLRQQNIVLPGGRLDVEGQEIIMRPSGRFLDIEDIEQTLIPAKDGTTLVPLRDIVTIARAYKDPPDALAYFNGVPAIVISVSILPGVNSVAFGEELTALLEQLENQLPIGYVLDYATFQPDLVVAAVEGALSNVYQTLVIVLVVVMLFLGLRTGLIVGSFVPITMLSGLLLMGLFGVELERVSIISSIVALGMLVDNAIVVAEDIRSRMERGEERKTAALMAGRTLAVPLLTSSLTTILAFTPMFLISGLTGEFIFSLPMVVTILLLASWFLAMFMTPALCVRFMKAKPPAETAPEAGGALEAGGPSKGFAAVFANFLRLALRLRLTVVAVALGLLVLAGIAAGGLVKEFFGTSVRNQILVYIDLPAGYRITATRETVESLTGWLQDERINPEVASSIAYVGNGGPRFFLSLSPVDPDPHVAFMVVNTKEAAQAPILAERLREELNASYPNVNGRVKEMWLGSSEPGLVEFRISGPNPEVLFEKGRRMTEALADLAGTSWVHNDWENKVLRVEVTVDQSRARRAGITSEDIALSLEAFLDGREVTEYREGDRAIPVSIRADDHDRQVLGDLWNVNVYSSARDVAVPLTQIADLKGQWQFSRIARYNQQKTVTVGSANKLLKAPQVVEAMQPAIAALALPPGYKLELGGEIEHSAESNEKLFGPLPVCVLLIFLLLVWQFNSYRRPVIVFLTIPMAFAGALAGLLVLRAPFDFFSILGFLSLAGVIVNNGIVLIDRIDRERKVSFDPFEAVVRATVSRFRPITMSAVTTVFGVMPIIVARDPLFYSLACVVASGLALGTVLTLVVVPVLYAIFFRIRRTGEEPEEDLADGRPDRRYDFLTEGS